MVVSLRSALEQWLGADSNSGCVEQELRPRLGSMVVAPGPDAVTINDLGCDYLAGGERLDLSRALFVVAARLGSVEALLNLGYVYWYGKGVAVNERKALACYRAAARRGSLDGHYEMGQVHRGSSEPLPAERKICPNPDDACACYAIAAAGGHRDAMFALGDLLLDPLYDGYDEPRGLYWLMFAAASGEPLAADRLACFYDQTCFGLPDPGHLMREFWRGYRIRREAAAD
jgi:TPR repeat protein